MMDSLLAWGPDTWVDYLLIYIMPGLGMATYFLINAWRERQTEFVKGMMTLLGKETSLIDRIKEALVYCFAISCVLLGWPGFVIYLFKHRKDEAVNREWQTRPDFECAPEYLVAYVTPLEAETASYIIDPLGGVTPLPFGHLNKGWVNFLSEMLDEGDEMWSFYIPKGSKTGKYQRPCTSDIRGYAKVRDGKVLGEFITECD